MTRIMIVRHGTTEWMEKGLLHGILDSKLSAQGQREARLAAIRLKQEHWDAFYSSPAGRALETARIIAAEVGIEPVVLEGLREIGFGWMEGRAMVSPMESNLSAWQNLRRTLQFTISRLTGEPWSQVRWRVEETLRFLLNKHPGGRVLLVTHAGTHSAILNVLLSDHPMRGMRMYRLSPCAITEVEVDQHGRGELIALNQKEHLTTDGYA